MRGFEHDNHKHAPFSFTAAICLIGTVKNPLVCVVVATEFV
jgi:hypothetical protein